MRAAPLSWEGDPSRVPSDRPPGPVDVVVPVHGAAAAFARCLASLAEHTRWEPLGHRLVLVLDGPQPAATDDAVERLAAALGEAVVVIYQPERRGFVESVNQGMALSGRDVVLLNSDTQVTAGWLGKLQQAAYSAPEIATATPFSNSATICSLPRFLESNALPAGQTVASFGELVERRSRRAYPRLPTGVGVCLYIKRKALDVLGLFDPATFGLGYGEESEWCTRALKAGFAHVLDDATFVYHEGHQSFGPSRRARVKQAHRALTRLHPEYLPTVAAFIAEDPIRPLRERVIAELKPARRALMTGETGRPSRVLHLVHGWPPWNPAGTEHYAAGLARRQARLREVTAYARIADPARLKGDALELLDAGVRVRLVVNNFDQRDPLSRNAIYDRQLAADFARLLDELRIRLLHVHHLSGHAAALVFAAVSRQIPVVFQIQDWWTPCARANLFDRDRRLCTGPGLGKCSACLPLTGLPPRALTNRALHALRQSVTRHALHAADAYIAGSRFLAESFRGLGWLPQSAQVHVLPYGVEPLPRLPRSSRTPGAPLRFGLIGSILPHKGIHVAARVFGGIDPHRATLTVWGDPSIDPAYTREIEALASPEQVRLAGRFAEEDKAATLAALDALLVPSLGLESYGIAAREAMQAGVPVLAARRGALPEMFEGKGEYGALFDPEDSADLARWIERLIAEPQILDRWTEHLPAMPDADEHAERVERVYAEVLAERARAERRKR